MCDTNRLWSLDIKAAKLVVPKGVPRGAYGELFSGPEKIRMYAHPRATHAARPGVRRTLEVVVLKNQLP